MKKIFALSLVLTGMLFFCACEKENSDLLIEDQAQTQINDSALKGAMKHAVPFAGRFIQEQTVFEPGPDGAYVEMEGLGNVTHLGKTSLWVSQIWEGNFPNLQGAADVVFTAANGDKLYAYLYAYNTIDMIEVNGEWVPVFATITGSGTFEGGTGRFSNASGTYSMTGDYDFATGVSNANYVGEFLY